MFGPKAPMGTPGGGGAANDNWNEIFTVNYFLRILKKWVAYECCIYVGITGFIPWTF